MLATNRHPSSTFLILKIIFSKKGREKPIVHREQQTKRGGKKEGGKREEAKGGSKETGKETEILSLSYCISSGSQCSDAKIQISSQSPS